MDNLFTKDTIPGADLEEGINWKTDESSIPSHEQQDEFSSMDDLGILEELGLWGKTKFQKVVGCENWYT